MIHSNTKYTFKIIKYNIIFLKFNHQQWKQLSIHFYLSLDRTPNNHYQTESDKKKTKFCLKKITIMLKWSLNKFEKTSFSLSNGSVSWQNNKGNILKRAHYFPFSLKFNFNFKFFSLFNTSLSLLTQRSQNPNSPKFNFFSFPLFPISSQTPSSMDEECNSSQQSILTVQSASKVRFFYVFCVMLFWKNKNLIFFVLLCFLDYEWETS
jgi:hypothetical protein